MILIRHPDNFPAERAYIFDVLFREFLGLEYTAVCADTDVVSLSANGKTLVVGDDFFQKAQNRWNDHRTLPILPLALWDTRELAYDIRLVSPVVPVLYGKAGCHVIGSECRLGLDIFGSAFFMLTRYEEVVTKDRDEHGRFPASASVAHQECFLARPIIDEYVEIIWACMKRLWPGLERKPRKAATILSCDVDSPYNSANVSLVAMSRRVGGDVLKRRSLHQAVDTLTDSWHWRRGDYASDSHLQALEWMMDVNERAGNRVAFYFITEHSHPTLDGCYSIDEPVIRRLVRRITERCHEIGLHGSYNTWRDGAQLQREADILRRMMKEEGVQQDEIGGRQHFLRWETPTTARHWEAAGMKYDSTLSFADRPGFRCGTCHEYPMFDLGECNPLTLRQRPLIVMECSVIAKRYLGMGYSDEALELMKSYQRTCHHFGGNFTLLWHNNHLATPNDKRFYQELIT